MLVGFITLFFYSLVEGKTCQCGRHCENFNGIKTSDQCYFIAPISEIYGNQFLVSNEDQEAFLIDDVLQGLTTKSNLLVSTNLGYKLDKFKHNCLPHSCNDTIYVKQCLCTLSFFENIGVQIKDFYTNNNTLFWIITVVLSILILSIILCIAASVRKCL